MRAIECRYHKRLSKSFDKRTREWNERLPILQLQFSDEDLTAPNLGELLPAFFPAAPEEGLNSFVILSFNLGFDTVPG